MQTFTIITVIENAIGEWKPPAITGVLADDIESVKRGVEDLYAHTGDTVTHRVI
jgi:hypothetical protein